MMNLLLLAIGTCLLASGIVDLLWTTLWVEGGAGPLTSLVMAQVWRTLRQFGEIDARILTLSGPIILTVSLAIWIVLLWSGWALIFASGEGSIIDTVNRDPVSWLDWVYFSGYSLFTLGNGDYAPQDGIWQIITTLTSASGMFFITLSVTYVLNVLSAVSQKRSFASGVSGLGTNGPEILLSSWNGEELEGLELPLNTVTTQLNTLTSNHKAYPILHYFHSKRPDQSPVVSVAILAEALSLLQDGLSDQTHPSNPILKNTRSSVANYLDTLQNSFIEPADQPPPSPNLGVLREQGIPTVSDEAFDSTLAERDDQRRTLLGLIESDEREWPALNDE